MVSNKLLTHKSYIMKKVLFFATCAIALLAGCQKTEINYDGEPQEIAFFAVNKTATKAPVTGTAFKDSDEIRVSAYLTATDANNAGNVGPYFENILFKKSEETSTTNWVGGQYWPLSTASMNFVSVTEKGGECSLGESKVSWTDSKFTVVLDNNVATPTGDATTPAETWNQTDLMYAVGSATNSVAANSTPGVVAMTFNHALAWVNFAFKTNVKDVITINSVDLYAGYNGTLTVTPSNYTVQQTADVTDAQKLGVETYWTVEQYFSKKVSKNHASVADALSWTSVPTDYTAYGNGLLVVPTDATLPTGVTSLTPYFVINYTITQSKSDGTTVGTNYTYKHNLTGADWDAGKKYTYNINMTLHQIEVSPTITEWVSQTATEVPLG